MEGRAHDSSVFEFGDGRGFDTARSSMGAPFGCAGRRRKIFAGRLREFCNQGARSVFCVDNARRRARFEQISSDRFRPGFRQHDPARTVFLHHKGRCGFQTELCGNAGFLEALIRRVEGVAERNPMTAGPSILIVTVRVAIAWPKAMGGNATERNATRVLLFISIAAGSRPPTKI
jgi:hypothetical protein